MCLCASEQDVVDVFGLSNMRVCRRCSAVQILAVLDRMDVLDFDKVAAYVASLQQVLWTLRCLPPSRAPALEARPVLRAPHGESSHC